MIVLDASVAVKLYREEAGSGRAHTMLREHAGRIAAPDIFAIEVAGALVREANMLKDRTVVAAKLATFTTLLASTVIHLQRPSPEGIQRAAALAIELGHPLKDCLYLALAIELACPLLTADERFAERARKSYGAVQTLA